MQDIDNAEFTPVHNNRQVQETLFAAQAMATLNQSGNKNICE